MRILTTSLRALRERLKEIVKTSRETNTSSIEGNMIHSWLKQRMLGFILLLISGLAYLHPSKNKLNICLRLKA